MAQHHALAARRTVIKAGGLAAVLAALGWRPDIVAAQPDADTAFGRIERLDPRFDALIPADSRLEVLADGFTWLEGPGWNRREGYLLFTDIPANAIHRWHPAEGVSLFMQPSGYSGAAPFTGRERPDL